jgi:Heterokaryon incompatibility protein (HET)
LEAYARSQAGEFPYLWADAICINQGDAEEKSRQVAQMKLVYQKALSVIAWLGPASPSSPLAVKILQDIIDGIAVGEQFREGSRSADWSTFPGLTTSVVRRVLTSHQGSDPSPFDALQELLNRPFWQRAWITQELSVNMSTTLYICGDQTISSHIHGLEEVIDLVVYFLETAGARFLLTNAQIDAANIGASTMIQAAKMYNAKKVLFVDDWIGPPLFDLLLAICKPRQRGTQLQATDQHDMIFALLGIAGDTGIRPDYSKSIDRVYTEATKAMIFHGAVDLLAYVQPGQSSLNLPS